MKRLLLLAIVFALLAAQSVFAQLPPIQENVTANVEVCIAVDFPYLKHNVTATDAYVGDPVYIVIRLENFWNVTTTITNGHVDIYDVDMKYIDTVPIPDTVLETCEPTYIYLEWDSSGQNPGTYFALSNVTYGGNYSTAIDDFELFKVIPPPRPPAGGGGGEKKCNLYEYDLSREIEHTYYLFSCDRVIVHNSVEVPTELNQIFEDYIYMTIYDPESVIVNGVELLGYKKVLIRRDGYIIIDIDGDGIDDLEIFYNGMIGGRMANVTYRTLFPAKPEAQLLPLIIPMREFLMPAKIIREEPEVATVYLLALVITAIVVLLYNWSLERMFREKGKKKPEVK